MEALIYLVILSSRFPAITEVCSNPLNETSGEFVEFCNDSTEEIDVAGYSVTDGDALDFLLP